VVAVSREGIVMPPYAYVPGRSPHPRNDPRGHSYGQPKLEPVRVAPSDWSRCATYRRGAALFDAAFYWESHEEFEALFHGAEPGPARDYFQGLIQIAAAHLKRATGAERPMHALAGRGLERLARVPASYFGVDVAAFRAATRAYFDGERDAAPRLDL
jgi:hypothetical protein